jgi:hypothetical protein
VLLFPADLQCLRPDPAADPGSVVVHPDFAAALAVDSDHPAHHPDPDPD